MSAREVAAYLECSSSTVRRIPYEELPYVKVGTHRRYAIEDVELYRTNRLLLR